LQSGTRESLNDSATRGTGDWGLKGLGTRGRRWRKKRWRGFPTDLKVGSRVGTELFQDWENVTESQENYLDIGLGESRQIVGKKEDQIVAGGSHWRGGKGAGYVHWG